MDLNNIVFRVVDHWSQDYRQAIALRYKLLRQPLGLKFSSTQFDEEAVHIHIVAKYQNQIIAYLCLIPFNEGLLRMRQVAVKKELQGLGIGRNLVIFSEKIALEKGFHKIFLHARENVIHFYLKLGYTTTGEIFTEINIPHQKMTKILS